MKKDHGKNAFNKIKERRSEKKKFVFLLYQYESNLEIPRVCGEFSGEKDTVVNQRAINDAKEKKKLKQTQSLGCKCDSKFEIKTFQKLI